MINKNWMQNNTENWRRSYLLACSLRICTVSIEDGTRTHLSVPLCAGQPHLPQHLRPLLHHQRPFVRVGGDIAVVLRNQACASVSVFHWYVITTTPTRSPMFPHALRGQTHHLHHLHLSLDPQLVEEGGQVLFHLDAVVVHLGHREDAHVALPPYLEHKNTFRILSWESFWMLLKYVCFMFFLKKTEFRYSSKSQSY